MKILLLGGTGEAIRLARKLSVPKIDLTYSIAGLVRKPQLDCKLRVGGFSSIHCSGSEGLQAYLGINSIDLLIDATHPYAFNMSYNAVAAARGAGVPVWRYNRASWSRQQTGEAIEFHELGELEECLSAYQMPFFTIGGSFLSTEMPVAVGQHWLVRAANKLSVPEHATLIQSIGPFSMDSELQLMRQYSVDALITKNSGGDDAKLAAAKILKIPVFIQVRPELPSADWQSHSIDLLHQKVIELEKQI